jgi:hypothetical protein
MNFNCYSIVGAHESYQKRKQERSQKVLLNCRKISRNIQIETEIVILRKKLML